MAKRRKSSRIQPSVPGVQSAKFLRQIAVAVLIVLVISTGWVGGIAVREQNMIAFGLAVLSFISAAIFPCSLIVFASMGENIAAIRELMENQVKDKSVQQAASSSPPAQAGIGGDYMN